MDASERSAIESALRARLDETVARGVSLEHEISGLAALRDPNNDDEHDPDGSPVSTEWSRLEGLRLENAAEQTAIRAALERLERGAFGVCERCGRPIAPKRLAVRPMAAMCVACAEALP